MRRAAVLAVLALLAAGPVAAQADAGARARQAAADLARAAERLEEARGAGDRVAVLTGTVGAYEDGLSALREGLRQLEAAERAVTDDLQARDAEIAALAGALTGMERSGGPLLLLHPSGPLGTVRAAMILSQAAPELSARAEELRRQLDGLRDLRRQEEEAVADLERGVDGIREARAALSEAIAERDDLPEPFARDGARVDALRARAGTLDAFADALGALTLDPAPAAVALPLPLPARGRVLRRFGEADAAGIARPGLVLSVAAGALVTAPASGSVRYAGPLLDYGNVIVMEPRAQALLVFAGLSEVYARAGEIVAEGAPLGVMGGASPSDGAADGNAAADAGVAGAQTLYIEAREAGRPVDPATWFALDG